MKREAKFTILFRHWLKQYDPMFSAGFELKQTTTDSLPFDAVKDHQIDALLAANSTGLLYKAPDDSRGIKPFDLFYLRGAATYVVIKYPSCFVLINIRIFKMEKEKSKRKSLTVKRAQQIAELTVHLR